MNPAYFFLNNIEASFCATGEGGGIDSSCGNEGGGGGGGAAPMKAKVKARGDERAKPSPQQAQRNREMRARNSAANDSPATKAMTKNIRAKFAKVVEKRRADAQAKRDAPKKAAEAAFANMRKRFAAAGVK